MTNAPPITLTTPELRRLCRQAENLKFSNGPNRAFWKAVDPSGVHIVGHWFDHTPYLPRWEGVDHPWNFDHGHGRNVRAILLCKMRNSAKPTHLVCDFDHDAFNKVIRPTLQLARP